MSMSFKLRAGLAVAACAAVGAAGGIVGSAAAPSKTKAKSSSSARAAADANGGPRPGLRHGGPGGPGHAVHAEEIVLDKAGDAYITQTEDQGIVKTVSGNDVTITEGTDTVPYKDVTVTLPSGATIMRNGAKAAAGDLKAGDHIHVEQSADGAFVFAGDASFRPPGGPRDHDGPPPAPPAAP